MHARHHHDVHSTTDPIEATDGTPLLLRTWRAGDPWAVVLLIHGVAEHSGRYERTGGLLAQAGISATAFDLRGNGGSGGRRADIERWTDLGDDIELVMARVRAASEGRPVVLLGHSMGGLLSTEYALSDRPQPDLLVLSAPALDDALPRWQHALGPVVARVAPRLALKNGWPPDALSRDPEVGRLVSRDPGCSDRTSARLGAAAFEAQARVRADLAELRIPALVLHGGDDRLVPTSASEPFESIPGVTRRVYPGLRHELFNEPEGPQVCADVIEWIRATVAAD